MEKDSLTIEENMMEEFADYLVEKEYARATIEKYCLDVRTFMGFLGAKREIDKEVAVGYKQWLADHYAVTSANLMIASLNQFLKCFGAGSLSLRQFKIQKSCFRTEGKELSKKEYQKLKKTALQEGKRQLAMIIETIAATGIRVGELKAFTVSGVRNGRIEVRNKGKYRMIILPGKLRKKLLCYIKKYGIREGSVFVTRNGKPKDRSNIWKEMKQLAQRAEVDCEKVFPHNLRHLFAREFYLATKDIIGLADLLGHSSITVTRLYTHSSMEYYKRKIDGLGLVC